jgi:hypothetical protein
LRDKGEKNKKAENLKKNDFLLGYRHIFARFVSKHSSSISFRLICLSQFDQFLSTNVVSFNGVLGKFLNLDSQVNLMHELKEVEHN